MLRRPPRWLLPCLLLVASLGLMGLTGGSGNGSTSNIPIPQENFTVTVTDRTGQSLEAKRFTWEGKVIFRGQIGNATVSLPFDKIRTVKVAAAGGDPALNTAKARVTLRTGETVDVMIDRTTKCYGETKFGNYEIFFKDIASITFH